MYIPNAIIKSMLMCPHDTQLFKRALTPVPLLHLPHKKPAQIMNKVT